MAWSRHLVLPLILISSLAACARPPVPPPPEAVAQGLIEALLDTGFYTSVNITRDIGMHHNPGEDAWTVLACFDFVSGDGLEGTNCTDSVRATRLTNGTWAIAVTIDEVYRWRAITPISAAETGA